VTWLVNFFAISRQSAIGVGELLRKTGAFIHVGHKSFSDDGSFFRMLSLEEFTSKRPLTPFENISKQMRDILKQPLIDLPVSKDLLRFPFSF
jgi:lauroyl/myristoyl acyltransferase